jgi:hypothetical protein
LEVHPGPNSAITSGFIQRAGKAALTSKLDRPMIAALKGCLQKTRIRRVCGRIWKRRERARHYELDDRDTRLRGRSFRSLPLVIHAHRMRQLPGATPSLERQRRPRAGSHDRLAADGITTEVCMSGNPAEHVRVRSGSRIRATTWGSRMLSPTFESMSAQNLLARDVLSPSWVFYRSPRTMRARVDSIRWRAQVELLLALACRRAARSCRTMGAIPSCDACGTPSGDAHMPEAEGGLTTDPRS